MYKNIVLGISLTFTVSALCLETPDLCHSGSFRCHLISPNSVVAYPIDNSHPDHYQKANLSNDTYERGVIDVDLSNLTWSAYNNEGERIRSGGVSAGKDYCHDINSECNTVTGTFTIYKKGGLDCKSTRFPVGKGGAPMPYCMFFHGGYALHGSDFVPNYNATHGCVRMSPEDAQWLNEDFVQEGLTKVNVHY